MKFNLIKSFGKISKKIKYALLIAPLVFIDFFISTLITFWKTGVKVEGFYFGMFFFGPMYLIQWLPFMLVVLTTFTLYGERKSNLRRILMTLAWNVIFFIPISFVLFFVIVILPAFLFSFIKENLPTIFYSVFSFLFGK